MKLVWAIVHPKDADACVSALTSAGFVCTRYESFGGFLEKENVTLMICVEERLVDNVIEILKRRGRRRNEQLRATTMTDTGGVGMVTGAAVDVEVGSATVWVIDAERFEKL